MRTSSFAGLVVATLASSLAACGGSSDSGSSGATGPAIDEIAALVTKAQCTAAANCFGALFDVFLQGESCEARIARQVANGEISKLPDALAAGTITYAPEKVQACLDKLSGASCSDMLTRDPAECLAALDGTVALGGACTYTFECKGAAFCKADATCPGTCAERLPAGQACKVDDDCASGLGCAKDTKTCTKPAAQGAACKGGSAPECLQGLICWGDDASKSRTGVCYAQSELFTAGELGACAITGATPLLCETGLACAIQAFAADGSLQTGCVKTVQASAACNGAFPSMCPPGQYCNVPQPASKNDTLSGSCVPLPTDGQTCAKALAVDGACAAEHVCDAGTCKKIADNGGACTTNDDCAGGSCQSGKCGVHTACTP